MKHGEQLTVIGLEKIDTLNYDIFYLEDGIENVIRITFTDAPAETNYSISVAANGLLPGISSMGVFEQSWGS